MLFRYEMQMVYLMPSFGTTECMEEDVPDEVKQNANHTAENGPASPFNGNAGNNNHVIFFILFDKSTPHSSI